MIEAISTESRLEAYKDVVNGIPDGLFILSGNVRPLYDKDGNRIGETATSYADSDEYGMLGGKARVIAAAHLAHVFPEMDLYTLSEAPERNQISWKVYRDELMKRGVSRERITSIRESRTTNQEIFEIIKKTIELGYGNIAIITNDYHRMRAGLMLENMEYFLQDQTSHDILEEFRRRESTMSFVSSEKVLRMISPHFGVLLNTVNDTQQAQKRFENEYRGSYKLIVEPVRYTARTILGPVAASG